MFWKIVAAIVSRPAVADWLITRAQRTPYFHLDGYMGRWWLFNRHDIRPRARWREWLPSVRIHHILRSDAGRHMHDHPWNARTIILRGFYTEKREGQFGLITRYQGQTATLKFGEFHRILNVPTGGVWTLFICWKYQGKWGFKVDGQKIPYDVYLDNKKQ